MLLMRKTVLLLIFMLASVFLSAVYVYSTDTNQDSRRNKVEEEIWAQEEAYFTYLYEANYEGVLALVHRQYLGWPDGQAKPVDYNESARFMKQLITKPTSCKIKVERAGIRVSGNTALTQYTLHVDCDDVPGAKKIKPSKITHTWLKEGGHWKLLGGMSRDQKAGG